MFKNAQTTMKKILSTVFLLTCVLVHADIYTQPDHSQQGGIKGSFPEQLTHAIAVDHERSKVFLGKLSNGGKSFLIEHLPVGKYDLVLVDAYQKVYEGLNLGDGAAISDKISSDHLVQRIAAADGFFNRYIIHRIGISTDGEFAFVFVERIRDTKSLHYNGTAMGDVRRLEVATLQKAADDWQQTDTRHVYREEEKRLEGVPFLKDFYLPELGNLRVINSVKELPAISISNN
jgi:hypothetical protein